MNDYERQFIEFICLVTITILILLAVTHMILAQSAGFGDICDNATGSPYVNYNPDLIANPIYATGDDYDNNANGCSWNLLPFTENDYRTPQIPITGISTEYVQYSFVAKASITDTIVSVQLNYVDEIGDNHPVVFDIPLEFDDDWQSFTIDFDGFQNDIGGPNSFVSMQFSVSDSDSNVWIDKIRMLPFQQGTATPTTTAVVSPTATDSPDCEYQLNAPMSPEPIMWLNAETLSLSYNHGDLIDSWVDYSGNGNSIFQSDNSLKATYVINNDLPAALFATDRYLPPLRLAEDVSFTLLIVADGTSGIYVESRTVPIDTGILANSPVQIVFQDGDGSPNNVYNVSGTTRTPRITEMSRDGNNSYASFYESVEKTTITYTNMSNWNGADFDTRWIGSREFSTPPENSYYAGYLYEFVLFSDYVSDLSQWSLYLSRWQCQDFPDPTPTPTGTITPTVTATPTEFPIPTSTRTPAPLPISTSTLTPIPNPTQTQNPTQTPIPAPGTGIPTLPAPGTPFPIPTPIVGGSCNVAISGNYDFCYDYGLVETECWIIIPTIQIIQFPGFQICFELYGVVAKVFGYIVPTYLIVVAIAFLIIWRWIL